MKIEIGKTYSLVPAYKKSLVEVEHWVNDHVTVYVTILWRGGEYYVTPQNKEEVKLLKQAMKENIELCVSDFEDYELRETFDGCSEELTYEGDWTEEQFETFKDEYWEDRWGTMEKYEFDQTDTDTTVCCEIELTEVKEEE